jgi:hypothetical protein
VSGHVPESIRAVPWKDLLPQTRREAVPTRRLAILAGRLDAVARELGARRVF